MDQHANGHRTHAVACKPSLKPSLNTRPSCHAADVADKFQTLVREVMSTELADLRKIGEETYFNETTKDYTQYVAYEIKKAAMFRFMKKQARTNAKISEQ